MKFWLRLGSDYLSEATPHETFGAAEAAYRSAAAQLWRYGQRLEATVHLGERLDDLDEYPDYVLTYDGVGVLVEKS